MKPGWLPYAGVAVASALATAVVTTAAINTDGGDRGSEIRAYLLEHPEVLPEAMDRLRAKQTAAQIDENRRAIETPYAGGWIGAKDGDVVLVQFFDYACTYCRASLPDVERLVREDPKIKVVFRELPILSKESEAAARVSLAAAEQGRFATFHDALYAAGRPSEETIVAAAQEAGLDPASTQAAANSPAVEQEIERNLGLARALGVTGTPAWVIGDKMLSGAVGYAALKQAVADARKNRT